MSRCQPRNSSSGGSVHVLGNSPSSERTTPSRSVNTLAGGSSPLPDSSSAITPKRADRCASIPSRATCTSPRSSTCASRVAVAAGTRSAIARVTTPPSASASTPRCATGRPACKVAARSSPPSKRSSGMFKGMRRRGRSTGSKVSSSANQRSRTGPAAARSQTPPSAAGSIARRAAACRARPHSSAARLSDVSPGKPADESASANGVTTRRPRGRTVRRWHARRAHPTRSRRADRDADGGAAPSARPLADV